MSAAQLHGYLPSIDWWLTSYCNLACDFCYGPRPDSSESKGLHSRLIGSICRSAAKTVTLCGGEPLVVKDVDQIIRVLYDRGKNIVLNTNGELLTRRRAEQLGLSTRIGIVGISLDGATPEIHTAMRGKNASFARTIDAIRLIKAESEVKLKIATVISSINRANILDLAELISGFDPAIWRIYQYSSRGAANLSKQRHHVSDADFSAIQRHLTTSYPNVKIVASSRPESRGCFILDYKGNVLKPTREGYRIVGSCLDSEIDELWSSNWGVRNPVLENKKWIASLSELPL